MSLESDKDFQTSDKLALENITKEVESSIINATQIENIEFTITITKNDSIKKRVDQILGTLKKGKPILIASRSNGISKAVSVVEIAKQQLKSQNISILQFNRLSKQTSLINPNYKNSTLIEGQEDYVRKILPDEEIRNLLPQETEERRTIENSIKEAVKGKKEYQLPLLHVLLVGEGKEVELDGWTKQ
ncbi:uncharacterized protein RJT20DRAFT_26049 [Scheffersomyces xylosifermentans]|uniref:uncharacterized protein n=1 Tax=Scheffersomyces xylosifermentans TaxID=1304137 RepID=UPI00315D1C45